MTAQVVNPHPAQKSSLPIVVGLVIIVLAVAYWYWQSQRRMPVPVTTVEPPASAPIESPDLGSGLIEKAQNPIKDQLPQTVAPMPNPLEGLYKNPFE